VTGVRDEPVDLAIGRQTDRFATAVADAYAKPSSLAVDLREVPVGSGYAIQEMVRRMLDRDLVGYRIVANSERARRALGTRAPLIGVVLEDSAAVVHGAPARRPTVVEGEFAVEVEFDRAERSCCLTVRGWRLALDLPASRQHGAWASLTADQIVADLGLLGHVMVSAPLTLPDWPRGSATLIVLTATNEHVFEVRLAARDEVQHLLGEISRLIGEGKLGVPVGPAFVLLGAERMVTVAAETRGISITHPQLHAVRLEL